MPFGQGKASAYVLENMRREKHGCLCAYDYKINPQKSQLSKILETRVFFHVLGEKLQFFALQPATHEQKLRLANHMSGRERVFSTTWRRTFFWQFLGKISATLFVVLLCPRLPAEVCWNQQLDAGILADVASGFWSPTFPQAVLAEFSLFFLFL